jgi:hypothetical protein
MSWAVAVRFPDKGKIFLFSLISRPVLGLPRPKRPESEADYISPFSEEVKKVGGILPLLHIFSWRGA